VLAAIGLVRHTLALFGGIVPRKASAHLRDLLTQTETLMLSDVSAQTAIYSPQTAAAKLALTEFLVTRGWRTPGCKSAGQNRGNFQTFCGYPSFPSCRRTENTFAYPLGDQYGDQLPRLARNIDSMLLLSGAYEGVKAQAWLENWQGLKHAIETRQHIEIEHFRNEAISQDPFWLHSGKR
jgi:triphosphatase